MSKYPFPDDIGIYPIGVVAKMLGVHPETLRVWERHEILEPHRENNQRKYSNYDVMRLRFISFLIEQKGLNLAGVKQVVNLYSCWKKHRCQGKWKSTEETSRVCWMDLGKYCTADSLGDWCAECELSIRCQTCSADKR